MTSEGAEQDTDAQQEDSEHPAEDIARECTSMHSDHLLTTHSVLMTSSCQLKR